MDRKVSRSLSAQLLCGALVSLLATIAAFSLALALGNPLFDHAVCGESFDKRMADREFSELQDFVNAEKITEGNIQRLNAWSNRNDLLSLIAYKGDSCFYASLARYQPDDGSQMEPLALAPSYEGPQAEYHLTLSDGEAVQAFLSYYAGDSFCIFLTFLSAAGAFAVFSGCFIAMVQASLFVAPELRACSLPSPSAPWSSWTRATPWLPWRNRIATRTR